MEGARIRSSVGLYRDVVEPRTVQDGDRTLNLQAGQRVVVDLVRLSPTFPGPLIMAR